MALVTLSIKRSNGTVPISEVSLIGTVAELKAKIGAALSITVESQSCRFSCLSFLDYFALWFLSFSF